MRINRLIRPLALMFPLVIASGLIIFTPDVAPAVPDEEAMEVIGGACGYKSTTKCSIANNNCDAITGRTAFGSNGEKPDTTSTPACSGGCGTYFDKVENCS